jgi:chromate transporter
MRDNRIDEDRFNELTTICQSVPGPTSTQLMISLATYVTGNVYGGIVAFLLFFGPSFLVMTLCGLFLSQAEVPML